MKTFQNKHVKKYALYNLVISLFIVTFFATIISPFLPSSIASAAMTVEQQQQCHDDFNGRAASSVTKAEAAHYRDCTTNPNTCNQVQTQISCVDYSDQIAANKAADAAEVQPLSDLVCGTSANTGEGAGNSANTACYNQVVASYKSCYSTVAQNNAQVTANCATPKLNAISGGNKVKVADVLAAIEAGRQGSAAVQTAAANAAKEKENIKNCEIKLNAEKPPKEVPTGKKWVDGKCVNDPAASNDSTCVIESIGWIVCPTLTFLGSIADTSYAFLSNNLLKVETGLYDTGSTTQTAWAIMRNFANVAFVIAFLIIIFSQLTSVGLSNYGIKKLLPRLIAAAILVNISYFICQLAVDLSNILGFAIRGLFDTIGKGIKLPDDPSSFSTANGSSAIGIAGIVATVLATAAGIYLALPFIGGAVIVMVITLLTIGFILIARKALIILLIVVSPLAFVSFLLPNTEKWFTRWRKLFVDLLLLFPIIALLFGAGQFASIVLRGAGTASGSTILQAIAAMVAVLPLLATITVTKAALSGVSAIQGLVNNAGGKMSGSLSKKADSIVGNSRLAQYKDYRGKKAGERRSLTQAGAYSGRNPLRRLASNTNRKLNDNSLFNTATGGYGAYSDLDRQAAQRKDAKEAMDMFGGDYELAQAWAQTGGDVGKAQAMGVTGARLDQFKRMKAAGHDKKAASFLAASQFLSENGQGQATDVKAALDQASKLGADKTEVSSAQQSAQAAYRNSGRGDAFADLSTLGNPSSPVSHSDGWKQIDPSKIHREAVKAGSAGRASYVAHINSDREYTRQALEGFDHMEARARNNIQGEILAAAQAHQYNETGTTPTISNIQQAKDYFGIK